MYRGSFATSPLGWHVTVLGGTWVRGRAVLSNLLRNRRLRAKCFPLVRGLLSGKSGIEVGGPSRAFRRRFGVLPVYPLVGHLDNCNFAPHTVWEGDVSEGVTFVYDRCKPAGRQFIAEVTSLSSISSGRYDFVLSSHTLEHTANPLKALGEMMNVLEGEGSLVLIVPHGEGTFDHRRPITTLAHLVSDASANVAEDDMTHYDEIMKLHDLALDPEAGTPEQFQARSRRNYENRCFHHHVFDLQLVVGMLDHAGMQVLAVETMAPHHIIAVARKIPSGHRPDNGVFFSPDAAWRRASVFVSDRSSSARSGAARVEVR